MRIVLMGGSLRPESLNTRYLGHLDRELQGMGHGTEVHGGAALRWPLYEDGLPVPEGVLASAEALRGASGLVIVSPEYNAGIPGHLKNAVDWLSVQKPSPWTGLPVLLAACSPGAFGGARALLSWRATLANMGAVVLPQALTIPHADQALDPTGRPVEARSAETTRRTLEAFATFCEKLAR